MLDQARRVLISTRGAILISALLGMWWVALAELLITSLGALSIAAIGTGVAILFFLSEVALEWYQTPV